MLTYLNRMSAKGMHLTGLNRFKNEFEQDKDVRYLYAICNVQSEDYYSEVRRWERVCEYKNLAFYRKRLPKDVLCVKKRGLPKKAVKERLWLHEMLKKGLVLFGKAEDEYIFERSPDADKTEYLVDYPPEGKDSDEYLYEKALASYECVSPSTDGATYYFIKVEGKEVIKGLRKLRGEAAVMKKRAIVSLLLSILMTAASVTAAVFALRYGKLILPTVITGASLTVISLTVSLVLGLVYKHEKKRIASEEKQINEFTDSDISEEDGNRPEDEGDVKNGATASQGGMLNGAPYRTDNELNGTSPKQDNEFNGTVPQKDTELNGSDRSSLPLRGEVYGSASVGLLPSSYALPSITESDRATDTDEWEYVDENDAPDTESEDTEKSDDHGEQTDAHAENGGMTYTPLAPEQRDLAPQSKAHGTAPYETYSAEYEDSAPVNEKEIAEHQSMPLNAPTEKEYYEGGTEAPPSRGRSFLKYHLLSGLFFMLTYLFVTAYAVTVCVLKYLSDKTLSPVMLVPTVMLAVFSPLVIYCGLASTVSVIKEIKRKNDF